MNIQVLYQGRARHLVTEAVLHCAAVPTGWHFRRTDEQIVADIRRWHMAPKPEGNGWRDIGYHYVVTPNGYDYVGRPLDQVGAHTLGYNPGKLGILLIERAKIDRIGKFRDFFNEKQRDKVRLILRRHGIIRVTGHNDYAPGRLCPGFKVRPTDFL